MARSTDRIKHKGKKQKERNMFCANCGTEMSDNALACPKCGEPTKKAALASQGKSRTVYGLLAFFLGGLGIHNFYAGRWFMAGFELVTTIFVVPFLSGWICSATDDLDSIFIVRAIGYLFIFVLVISEMLTVKKDGKGVPFCGYESK